MATAGSGAAERMEAQNQNLLGSVDRTVLALEQQVQALPAAEFAARGLATSVFDLVAGGAVGGDEDV